MHIRRVGCVVLINGQKRKPHRLTKMRHRFLPDTRYAKKIVASFKLSPAHPLLLLSPLEKTRYAIYKQEEESLF